MLEKLLDLMNTKTKQDVGFERALYLLLRKYQAELPELNDYFHKAFRQIDVIMEPYMDGVLWLLLSESNVFWECYAEVVEKDNADISGNSKILGE